MEATVGALKVGASLGDMNNTSLRRLCAQGGKGFFGPDLSGWSFVMHVEAGEPLTRLTFPELARDLKRYLGFTPTNKELYVLADLGGDSYLVGYEYDGTRGGMAILRRK